MRHHNLRMGIPWGGKAVQWRERGAVGERRRLVIVQEVGDTHCAGHSGWLRFKCGKLPGSRIIREPQLR